MWGGPLREAIWAPRGSQEDSRTRKDQANAKKLATKRPQSDDDLEQAGHKSKKTPEQRRRTAAEWQQIFEKREKIVFSN